MGRVSDTCSRSTLWGRSPHPSIPERRAETVPILTTPWGPFPSRTKPPSGEAGSNEGERFASTQTAIQPPGLATAVLEGSQPEPTTGYVGQRRQWERRAGGPACRAHLAAFAFVFPLVSWGSFTNYIRAWLRPVVTSQRTGWDNRASVRQVVRERGQPPSPLRQE